MCDDIQVVRIGVALHESLTNAIYHGNLELDSELRQEDESIFHDLYEVRRHEPYYAARRVYVQATASRHEIRYVIRDEGQGFDVHKVSDPTEEEQLGRVGGRGLLMIRSFMDEVTHNEKGNQITLVKSVGQPAQSDEESANAAEELQLV